MTNIFYEQIIPNRALPFRLLVHDNGTAHTVLPHWHQSFELDYVIRGVNKQFTLNNQTFEQATHELVVVNPYEVHGLSLPLAKERIALTVMLPASFIHTTGILIGDVRIKNRIDNDRHLITCFEQLYLSMKHSTNLGTQATQIGLVYKIIGHLFRQYATHQSHSSTHFQHQKAQMDRLAPALNWIEHHYQERITVPQLAQVSSLSPSYFAHLFKTYLKQTPLTYVDSRRLVDAKKLITNTQNSIEQIALVVGFSSTKALNSSFHRHYNQTASEYRKHYLN
ncbi:helix-turn-helix domain-containing protein [Lactiplantibacillus pentosus]|jgi:AraC-like DNA-binding protein|uniref:helix-turn-helix domain-containing protein n=1 Tax=Lactiplantibacillus pentosus TaxID=1589 RepID=UPI000B53C188|nr:AraC family transcriptional regulator [Lactiplantibacillus pentosus]ASG79782.1 hypothetical protein CEW82_07985 [Lactiplantibacillus pentosus]USJ86322.1 AraC family transcriptional regulator [Lactiplantibacillus pentosus]